MEIDVTWDSLKITGWKDKILLFIPFFNRIIIFLIRFRNCKGGFFAV